MTDQGVFKRPYFLDTSALVKLVIEEEGSQVMRQLRQEHGGRLHTSHLAISEALGVLKRHWLEDLKRAKGDQDALDRAYATYRKRLANLLILGEPEFAIDAVDPTAPQIWAALRELRPGSAVVDAVDVFHAGFFMLPFFASLAGPSKPIMVSADKELNEYCRSRGVTVLDPIDEEKKQKGS